MAYSDMYGNVRDRARQSNTWSVNRIKEYLNKAQGVIWRMAKEWKQLEKQDTTTAVIGQENYAVPADFERAIRLQIESGNDYYTIAQVSYDSVRESLNQYTGNTR